jgi:hypothetical protein
MRGEHADANPNHGGQKAEGLDESDGADKCDADECDGGELS